MPESKAWSVACLLRFLAELHSQECFLLFLSFSCCFWCCLLWLKVSETALTSCACVSPEQVSSRRLQPSLLPTLHHQGHAARGGPGGGLRSAQVRLRSHRNHCKYTEALFAPSMLVLSFCVVTLVSCFFSHKSFAPPNSRKWIAVLVIFSRYCLSACGVSLASCVSVLLKRVCFCPVDKSVFPFC